MELVKAWSMGLVLAWLAIPALALMNRHRGAVLMACATALAAAFVHLPRSVEWLVDAAAHEARYGAWAQIEVRVGLAAIALLTGAWGAAWLAWRRPWWLVVSAGLSLPMVLFGVWLGFFFRIFG